MNEALFLFVALIYSQDDLDVKQPLEIDNAMTAVVKEGASKEVDKQVLATISKYIEEFSKQRSKKLEDLASVSQ